MEKLLIALLAFVIPSLAASSELTFADSAGNTVSMECEETDQELAKLMDPAKAAKFCRLIENALSKEGLPQIQSSGRIAWETIGADKSRALCHIILVPWMSGQAVATLLCMSGDAAKKESLETRVKSAIHAASALK